MRSQNIQLWIYGDDKEINRFILVFTSQCRQLFLSVRALKRMLYSIIRPLKVPPGKETGAVPWLAGIGRERKRDKFSSYQKRGCKLLCQSDQETKIPCVRAFTSSLIAACVSAGDYYYAAFSSGRRRGSGTTLFSPGRSRRLIARTQARAK